MRGPHGFDTGKKVFGRKRVALVDTDGCWLAVAVVPASVQDRDTLPALDTGKAEWPSLRQVIPARHAPPRRGARRRAEGFVVLARRWVVERSFGWLTHWRGLLRDRAGRLDVAAGAPRLCRRSVRHRGRN